jgi:ribosomal protein L11 methyltransferase
MLSWRKITSPMQADHWAERLTCFGPERLVITETGRCVRLELFDVTDAEAEVLRRQFGGAVHDLARSNADWARASVQKKPIAIRDRLQIFNAEPAPGQASRDDRALYIPAGMAFGTGDHATTATCLRLLCDLRPRRRAWSSFDVGCGTGMLTLAAAKLGADPAEGFDHDPVAVRIATENARLNHLPRTRFDEGDILQYVPPQRCHDVVFANIYSDLLVRSAAQIWATVAPAGLLLASGILRRQVDEVRIAFAHHGAKTVCVRCRGKWATLAFSKEPA